MYRMYRTIRETLHTRMRMRTHRGSFDNAVHSVH